MTVQHLMIVVDLDGTIADFHGALIERVGPPQSQDGWGFEEWYKEPKQIEAANAFVADPESYRNLQLLPAAKKSIKALADAGHKLIAVTARPPGAKEITEEWLRRHFRGCFIEVHVVGPEEKVPTIVGLWPHMVVDDNQKTVEALREIGVNAVIFTQPWNWKCDPPRTNGWTHFRKVMGT